MKIPKISFGIIVLNGEPFTRYCLRSIYPFAYEIIVVEGAAYGAADIATPDGHSIDDTLIVLEQFQKDEDPQKKIQIVTRDGFWSEKDEQSQAYAQRATGDWLWQVDIDEFYKPEDMTFIMAMLLEKPGITAVSFPMLTFWGGLNYVTDGCYLRQFAAVYYHRLFKWGQGYKYSTHRPPTVLDAQGIDTRRINWLRSSELRKLGIYFYHYSLLFPKQVQEKCIYYQNVSWVKRTKAVQWANDVFRDLKHPYRIHNVYEYPSWLERFHGLHPPSISQMMDDIRVGKLNVELRPIDDIETLLNTWWYPIGKWGLIVLNYIDMSLQPLRERVRPIKHLIKQLLSAT